MDTNFPVVTVTKNAFSMPLESVLDIFKGIGLLILGIIAASVLLVVFIVAGGVDAGALENLPVAMEAGDFSGLGLSTLFGMVFALFAVLMAVAHIFNYWVRFAAFGKEGTKFDTKGAAFKAAFVNSVKFLLIGLLILIVSLVLQSVLSTFGLTDSFGDQMTKAAEGDIAEQVKGGLLGTILSTLITCLIYSLFSANLTQTAVGSDKEGIEHPHTMDFAIVLVLLYASYLVPFIIAALLGLAIIANVIVYTLGIYVMFAVAIAHGLRYRICIHELGKAEEADTSE